MIAAEAAAPVRRNTRFWTLFRQDRMGMIGLVILILFIALALAAPVLFGPAPQPGSSGAALANPSATHPLGTDEVSRDVLALVAYGSRISLLVGLLATLISVGVGALVGILAGFYGGYIDTLLMRVTDFFLVLPALVVAIIVTTIVGPSLSNVIIIIGLTSWPGTARIIRAQTLTVKERAFVARSRAYGASGAHLMLHHILPNVWSLIMASSTLTVATAIFLETTLAFLGLSDPNEISWGTMMNHAFVAGAAILDKWGYLFAPGVAVSLVIVAFTFIGRAFDRILNPRLRERHL